MKPLKYFKKMFCLLLCCLIIAPLGAAAQVPLTEPEASAYILMEKETGTVLLKKNETEHRPMASITKLMTALLILEDIDSGKISLSDPVTASANASAMGGSQIYLKENEVMDVNTLLKSIFVASANDACIAMAEHLEGSEEAFVKRMNERASELGLTDTVYKNPHGLDDDGHYSSALDIATLSRLVLSHDLTRTYTGIWQEKIRNDTFELTNTNKLIRFYDGATGLKTGSTTQAGSCLSASAKRNGMELIAVVLNSPTGEMRFTDAKRLLDYGFANYKTTTLTNPEEVFSQATVSYGKPGTVNLYPKEGLTYLQAKDDSKEPIRKAEFYPLTAPVSAGSVAGKLIFEVDGETVGETELIVRENVAKQSFWDTLWQFFKVM